LSDEFKKLIWQFFSYHYFERISIEKMKASKWMLQSTDATLSLGQSKENIVKEMTRRKLLLEEKKFKASGLVGSAGGLLKIK
jgi:hypothetical protein